MSGGGDGGLVFRPVGSSSLPGPRTHVRTWQLGPPGAPTVVLLHRWAMTAAMNWSPSFGPLSERFRVIVLTIGATGEVCERRRRSGSRTVLTTSPCSSASWASPSASWSVLDGGPIAQLLSRQTRTSSPGSSCAHQRHVPRDAREWVLSGLATGGSLVGRRTSVHRCCPRPRPAPEVARRACRVVAPSSSATTGRRSPRRPRRSAARLAAVDPRLARCPPPSSRRRLTTSCRSIVSWRWLTPSRTRRCVRWRRARGCTTNPGRFVRPCSTCAPRSSTRDRLDVAA